MSIQRKTVGVTLATAAAALFIAGAGMMTAPVSAQANDVKCMGINACKGLSECKTASNECKGLNTCKGHGWAPTATAEECTSKGGEVIE